MRQIIVLKCDGVFIERMVIMAKHVLVKIMLVFENIFFAFQSLFYKRDERVVLFGSWFGKKFCDNTRFLFQYLVANKAALGLTHVVWVTHDASLQKELSQLGYEAFLMNSSQSIFFHKRAKIHIVCNSVYDIQPKYSFGAIRVNLWHGIGAVKRFGKGSLLETRKREKHRIAYAAIDKFEKTMVYRKFMNRPGGWGDFYLLSPNEVSNKQFYESFGGVPSNRFVQSTYPRVHLNSVLLKKEETVLKRVKQFQRVILYMPTFRQGKQDFCFSELGESLKSLLQKEDILWVQKAHSASNLDGAPNDENNVLSLSTDFETNLLLPYITLLITDYSSVATDARYFNKPVVFYLPDYEAYKSGDNGLTVEAEELLSGPKYYDIKSLKEQIVDLVNSPEKAKPDNYELIRKKYWGPDLDVSDVWNKIYKLR